jgi:hypothetical protein
MWIKWAPAALLRPSMKPHEWRGVVMTAVETSPLANDSETKALVAR